MVKTPTDSNHFQFKDSGSISRIENPTLSISESITDHRLPQELITDILLRLPVKCLLKCKCVSNPWLSLISSAQFIKSHFCKSSTEGEFLNHQLLITHHNPAPVMKQCSLYSVLHESDTSTHIYDIEYPSQNPVYPPWIVGIINGLVCLHINANDLFLWNPLLRKSKHLPSSNVDMLIPDRTVNFGFGYDESNDDYKVVSMLWVYGTGVFDAEVEVYSLRADSWKRIEDLKGFRTTYCTGKYSNGKIYWYVIEAGAGDSYGQKTNRKIVSLDITSEKYEEVKQPPHDAGLYGWKLGLLGGRLFVLCDYDKRKADLWVLDNYGVEESWSKVFTIPYDIVHPRTPFSHQQVLCIFSTGEIVLEHGYGFMVYHSKLEEARRIELDVGTPSSYKVYMFAESLVSPI